ncbi:MAG: PA2779 family protein [Acidobacteriaceae bacterium]
MSFIHRRYVQLVAAMFLFAVFVVPQLAAQSHVVSPADLQKEAVSATQARQQNIDSLTKALSTTKVQQAMKAAQIDPAQVKTAVSSLSNSELAQLAARANNAQNDFAAGRIDDHDLLLILVAVAALILIIVAVH